MNDVLTQLSNITAPEKPPLGGTSAGPPGAATSAPFLAFLEALSQITPPMDGSTACELRAGRSEVFWPLASPGSGRGDFSPGKAGEVAEETPPILLCLLANQCGQALTTLLVEQAAGGEAALMPEVAMPIDSVAEVTIGGGNGAKAGQAGASPAAAAGLPIAPSSSTADHETCAASPPTAAPASAALPEGLSQEDLPSVPIRSPGRSDAQQQPQSAALPSEIPGEQPADTGNGKKAPGAPVVQPSGRDTEASGPSTAHTHHKPTGLAVEPSSSIQLGGQARRPGEPEAPKVAPNGRENTGATAGEQAATRMETVAAGRDEHQPVNGQSKPPLSALPHNTGKPEQELAAAHGERPSTPQAPPPSDQAAEAAVNSPALSPADAGEPGEEVARVRAQVSELLPEIVRRAQLISAGGRTQVRIQLEPPSLGRVSLLLTSDHNAISIHLRAETPEVRDLVQAQLPQLLAALHDQGIRVDRLLVHLGPALFWFDAEGRGQRPTTNGFVRRSQAIEEDQSCFEGGDRDSLLSYWSELTQHIVDYLA